MAKAHASIPQGTRDFGPETMRKRSYIFNTIRTVFELYGFQPLETPAMENIETLMDKYGEEGDKLIFKILNNGLNDPKNIGKTKAAFENVLAGKNDKDLTERALRYDLTIPFARYVAMNYAQLTMPFKRYQIQPVWRADRPQKGRYREFYQCDADVVGSNSLINEVELAITYATVFERLGIDVVIKINHRKILTGVAEAIGAPEKIVDMTVAIDKFDKIGWSGVKQELVSKGFTDIQIGDLTDYVFAAERRIVANNVQLQENEDFTFHFLRSTSPKYFANETFNAGVKELEELLKVSNLKSKLQVDLSLARGLNYYTGVIFEVKAKGVQIGSIGGGGRYDDLTGTFGVPNIPGVGISFGVDRIYDVMEELKLFPAETTAGTRALFFNLGDAESKKAFELMQQLRANGTSCELYHEAAKFDKQFRYAEKKNILYVVIIGSSELAAGTCTIKNLQTGQQESIPQNKLAVFPFVPFQQ